MDWCVDTRVPEASRLIQGEIAAHLGRHAIEPAAVELARPDVQKALEGADPGPLWVTLDWSARSAVLKLHRLPGDDLPGEPLGPGATVAIEEASRLAREHGGRTESEMEPHHAWTYELAVARPLEPDIDLAPDPPDHLPDGDPRGLLGLITGAMGRGSSLEEAATRAGATLADHVASLEPGREAGVTGAADRLVEAERHLGADFHVVEAHPGRVVVRNRRCPFGPATSPSMCRFTSALAGGLAARESGRADVSVLESLAAGDRECRLVIDTDERLDRAVSHRYTWPSPQQQARDEWSGPDTGRGFQVALSLQLPRDRLSVPITRHLIRAAMDEVGVVAEDADAVDLAVTEACANVIDHSGPGDAYDVVVSIGPSACHIRVVDVGRGFDHEALAFSPMADQQAEHGRGVALMHALVDQVRFESEPERGTVVHLVKRLSFEETAAAHRLMRDSTEG